MLGCKALPHLLAIRTPLTAYKSRLEMAFHLMRCDLHLGPSLGLLRCSG
jgi:hypothetical protein